MKDLEKIKSEDLAAQVQDANPGNFAIEQEVAQLVGATVPQPTQPSADDARELGAQLLVFLRRALLPIRSALRTAVAAIYAHLDSRCTDYTPAAYASFTPTHHAYDPMGSTPRTLPNLLTALTAFSARKIYNGSATADGIPDGESLAKLVCAGAAIDAVTEVKDDNHGWIMTRALPYKNAKKVSLGCSQMQFYYTGYGDSRSTNPIFANFNELEELNTEDMTTLRNTYGNGNQMDVLQNCPKLKTWYAPNFGSWNCSYVVYNCPNLERVVWGTLKNNFVSAYGNYGDNFAGSNANLIDFEIGAGTAVNLNMEWWNPTNVLADADKTATFLQNFKEHIALRLTANGSGKTLTLSQAVRDAIHAAEATYGIEAIIVTQKGWTLSPAPGASSQ